MGVRLLWPLLKPRASSVKLQDLRGHRIAIDAPIWIYQSLKSAGPTTQAPHLVGFIDKVNTLVKHGIKPVFVFDGAVPKLKKKTIASRQENREKAKVLVVETTAKISIQKVKLEQLEKTELVESDTVILSPKEVIANAVTKKNIAKTKTVIKNLDVIKINEVKKSRNVTSKMYKEVQGLLSLLGIPCIVAPMEAEAQCAYLYMNKFVDGIITTDSDIFLLGGSSVYKDLSPCDNFIDRYDMKEKTGDGLSREQLIQFSYLMGCDYNSKISKLNCPKSAIEIIKNWPSSGLDGLRAWKRWTMDLRNGIFSNSDSTKQIKLRSYSEKIQLPDSFPDPSAYDLYMKPVVKQMSAQFVWGDPDLKDLQKFLLPRLGWSCDKIDSEIFSLSARIKANNSRN